MNTVHYPDILSADRNLVTETKCSQFMLLLVNEPQENLFQYKHKVYNLLLI